jgi:hypothetical protein
MATPANSTSTSTRTDSPLCTLCERSYGTRRAVAAPLLRRAPTGARSYRRRLFVAEPLLKRPITCAITKLTAKVITPRITPPIITVLTPLPVAAAMTIQITAAMTPAIRLDRTDKFIFIIGHLSLTDSIATPRTNRTGSRPRLSISPMISNKKPLTQARPCTDCPIMVVAASTDRCSYVSGSWRFPHDRVGRSVKPPVWPLGSCQQPGSRVTS